MTASSKTNAPAAADLRHDFRAPPDACPAGALVSTLATPAAAAPGMPVANTGASNI